MRLWPFFTFYGGKWRAAPHYPAPTHPKIIEPFAGSAGYSLHHYQRDVVLYDLDENIVGVWDYLIHASEQEIKRLPIDIDSLDTVPFEARNLIGFWFNKGAASPCKTPSSWMRSGSRPKSYWGAEIRERIASQVALIRHWRIEQGSYEQIENQTATWFIDPPYNNKAGRLYRCSEVDYGHLAVFCQNRRGQVIVCEQEGATWLPFEPLGVMKSSPSSRGKSYSREAIWLADAEGKPTLSGQG